MNLEYAQGKIDELIAAISDRLSPDNDELLHDDIYNDYIDKTEIHLKSFYEKEDPMLYGRLTVKLNQGKNDWEHYEAEDKLERLEAFLKNNVATDLENRIQRDRDSAVAGQPYSRDELKATLAERTLERDKFKQQFDGCKKSYLELQQGRDMIASEVSNLKATLSADMIVRSQQSDTQENRITTLQLAVDHTKQEALKWRQKAEDLQKEITSNDLKEQNDQYKILFYITTFLFLNALVFLMPPTFKYNYNWKNVILLEVGFVTILPVLFVREIPNYVAIIIGIVLGIVSVFEF